MLKRILDHPILRERTGPLTHDLVQTPGAFGLGAVPARLQPDAVVDSVCGFCATGCSLSIHLKDGEAINLTPRVDYPVNLGMACPKGWEALSPLSATDRGTTPLRRGADGKLKAIDWPEALRAFVDGFRGVQERHGPASTAFLSTGQIVTEEMALLGAFAKFGMGMIHGDGNTRQCMATAATAYKESFGFDAPPFTYQDFEESDVIVLVGSNLCIAHPIKWQRVLRNPNQPEIIVIDPRKTETAMCATQHLPLAPKSDLTLLYGLARIARDSGGLDSDYISDHTSGFEAFSKLLDGFPPERVAAETRLPIEMLLKAGRTIASGRRVSFWWTMGVNQGHQATRTAQAIINLALMTGNIGRPGTGANSITGQCNAMGSRIFSNTTSLLGGRDFKNAGDREHVARVLDIPVERIPSQPSWAYDQIMEGIGDGSIRGLWVIATNTAHSWIHQDRARELLDKLEFLVVQDMYPTTETAQRAHLYLPAAGWGEKEGTFINSERRIGRVRKVAKPPGQALPDFAIVRLLAEAWGCAGLFEKWSSPAATFQILRKLSKSQPCDFSGIEDHDEISARGGIQWPWSEEDVRHAESTAATGPSPERRLFEDGKFFTPDGKARFVGAEPEQVAEPTSAEYPLVLLTGRGTSSQWHTQTRTSKSDVLRKLYPKEIYAEIHPTDAAAIGLKPEARVRIRSRRGEVVARAWITPTVGKGQLFLPMHYEETNRLTRAVFDPLSRQPSYKHAAVSIERIQTQR